MVISPQILILENMEDLNKNAETEKTVVEKNGSKKEPAAGKEINTPKVTPKRIRVRVKTNPATSPLIKSPVRAKNEIITPQAKKPIVKKAPEAETKIPVIESSKKVKSNPELKIQNLSLIESKGEQGKPDMGKEEIKVIKKKAKKAEEKVDKLKKKVKKAKKKDVKKSKLKSLKEKLGKALKRLKIKVKELEKSK